MMVRRFAIALVCLLLLSLAPLALAQDLGESISEDGFTYPYPSSWVSEVTLAGTLITNNEDRLDPDVAAQGVPEDSLLVQIAGGDYVRYATGGTLSAKFAVMFFSAFLQLPGDLTQGSFDNVDYVRFEARDPERDTLYMVYGLDFGNAVTLVIVHMGGDYDEVPPVILDMLTSITYEPPPRPAVSEDDTIAYGDEFISELTEEGEEQALVFEGSAGDLVTISMNSEVFDPLLRLYSEASDELLMVDDDISIVPEDLNAQIASFQLPEDGRYVIAATTAGGMGEYTLTLQEGVIPVERALFVNWPPDIAYRDTVIGELNSRNDAQMWHIFEGSAGDVVTITLIAENENELDTWLELYAARGYDYSDGVPIAFNDDVRGSTNSQIVDFILPEDGNYVIIVRSPFGYDIGEYTLTLEKDSGT